MFAVYIRTMPDPACLECPISAQKYRLLFLDHLVDAALTR